MNSIALPRVMAFLLALVCAGYVFPAKADLQFYFHNISSHTASKGIVSGHGADRIIWQEPGKIHEITYEGDWYVAGTICWGSCNSLMPYYTVHFEHLSNGNIKCCTWKVEITVNQSSGTAWGSVHIDVTPTHQAAGVTCLTAGQRSALWHATSRGQGAYLEFKMDAD